MPDEKTSKKVGRIASKTLSSKSASKKEKTLAGSALTQRPNKKGKYCLARKGCIYEARVSYPRLSHNNRDS